MCTLIYIPRENGLLLCSVRDENPHREKALVPSVHEGVNGRYLSPVDGRSGGTWFGINDHREVAVLLNGGFINHLPAVRSYGKSRGLIVKKLLSDAAVFNGWDALNLETIEPFTLVAFHNNRLKECVWDGKRKHERIPEQNRPLIWSSATLYPPDIRQFRERLFAEWLDRFPAPDHNDLLGFLYSFDDPGNGFVMQRSEALRSLSISLLNISGSEAMLKYHDLLTAENFTQSLAI